MRWMRAPVLLISMAAGFPPHVVQGQTFPNGIAAGDVSQDSVVLWARSTALGDVTFEYSTTPDFSSDVQSVVAAAADPDIPVKVSVGGLTAGTQYYYRVTNTAVEQLAGSFRTPAAPGTYSGLRFGVGGDWRGNLAPHPAIKNIPSRDLDFFVALGDTTYADITSPDLPGQAETLDEFRIKHAEVYGERFGENFWDDARSSTAVFATIDDHEIVNDFSGGGLVDDDTRFTGPPGTLVNDAQRYEDGMTAFKEYNPIADEFYGATGDPVTANERKLYRYRRFGSDAALFVLDARSFRDEALDDVTNPFDVGQINDFLNDSFDPSRTMLGAAQLQDLKDDLLDAQNNGVMWKFIMMPEPIQHLGMLSAADRYEGYMAERTEILQYIKDNDIDHVVFIAADIHGALANNLTYQQAVGGPQIETDAFEVVVSAAAFNPTLGRVMLQFADAVEVSPGVTLLDVMLDMVSDEVGFPVPNVGTFHTLSESVKNDAIDWLFDEFLIKPLGYDPLGLDGSGLDVTVLSTGFSDMFSYGWTEFEIDANSRALTVTTYGISQYTVSGLNNDPAGVLAREPMIISQYVIADPIPEPGTLLLLIPGVMLLRVRSAGHGSS